jgi:large subunit ribosomal protein L23
MMMSPYDVILQPWLTEKTMEARASEQRLEFIVHRSATKEQIARAVEAIFDVEVAKVNVRNSKHGKHASVKLAEGYDAEDAAMRMGAF